MSFEILAKQGNSTRYETLAATILPRIREIRKESIKESLTGFSRVEHRLEYVLSIQGIEFINDSRSTTINSTWFALSNYPKPIVWIAGGVESGNDYRELIPVVREKVKAIVCLGKGNHKIIDTFSSLGLPISRTSSMEDAVLQAYYLSSPGDVVLLSPACASFDLFSDLEERGKAFKKAVKNL
jgi:UDP-N-acetylmuramoylalanine--D-glutamate ligase